MNELTKRRRLFQQLYEGPGPNFTELLREAGQPFLLRHRIKDDYDAMDEQALGRGLVELPGEHVKEVLDVLRNKTGPGQAQTFDQPGAVQIMAAERTNYSELSKLGRRVIFESFIQARRYDWAKQFISNSAPVISDHLDTGGLYKTDEGCEVVRTIVEHMGKNPGAKGTDHALKRSIACHRPQLLDDLLDAFNDIETIEPKWLLNHCANKEAVDCFEVLCEHYDREQILRELYMHDNKAEIDVGGLNAFLRSHVETDVYEAIIREAADRNWSASDQASFAYFDCTQTSAAAPRGSVKRALENDDPSILRPYASAGVQAKQFYKACRTANDDLVKEILRLYTPTDNGLQKGLKEVFEGPLKNNDRTFDPRCFYRLIDEGADPSECRTFFFETLAKRMAMDQREPRELLAATQTLLDTGLEPPRDGSRERLDTIARADEWAGTGSGRELQEYMQQTKIALMTYHIRHRLFPGDDTIEYLEEQYDSTIYDAVREALPGRAQRQHDIKRA